MQLVSILIPVYNVEKFIERCARSLFEQSYSDLEFVFVDDCSTDKSIDILYWVLKDYPEKQLATSIIQHDHNKGVAAARNTLLDHASGDFISYVDADDWLEKDAIELLMQKQMEEDFDIVSGNAYMHYENDVKVLNLNKYQGKDQLLFQQLKNTWTMDSFLWGRIYRRSLFENYHIRSKEGFNYAEDRYQVVQLTYYAEHIDSIDDIIYNYEKRNKASITKAQNTDISIYLRNQYQHLQNWIGIRDFFMNKEKEYYQLAVANSARLLKLNFEWSLKYKTKNDFDHIVELIDENDDCMRALEWQKTGIKGRILHCYGCMWLMQFFKRLWRFISRKIHRGIRD